MRFLYPICISLLFITLSLCFFFCFFFNFKNILYVLFWLTSLIFSLFFMTADCISFVWVHLAFFFLSVQVKKNRKPTKKKKSTWVRAPCEDLLQWSIFTSNESFEKAKRTCCFSWLCSCGWKEESSSQLLWINTQSDLGSASESLKTIQPFSTGQFARDPACWVFLLPPGGAFGLHSIWTFILCLPDSFSPHQHLF